MKESPVLHSLNILLKYQRRIIRSVKNVERIATFKGSKINAAVHLSEAFLRL